MNFHEDELHLSQHLLIIAIPADPLARRRHLRHVEQPLVDLNSHFVVLINTNRSVRVVISPQHGEARLVLRMLSTVTLLSTLVTTLLLS